MKIFFVFLIAMESLAIAQDHHGFDCKVKSFFGESTIHAETSPSFTVELLDPPGPQLVVLTSMSQICGWPMDFEKNCTLIDKSEPNFVSFSVSCYENKDENDKWLASFSLAFHESSGSGMSHCSTPIVGTKSYEISKCSKY